MAEIDQLNINIGTEANPYYVLHDVQDYRLNHLSTLTTTISDIIGRNGSTFGAITPQNLASVLGVATFKERQLTTSDDLNNFTSSGMFGFNFASSGASRPANMPSYTLGTLIVINSSFTGTLAVPLTVQIIVSYTGEALMRTCWSGSWNEWETFSFNIPSFYKSYSDLSSLASALGGVSGTKFASKKVTSFDELKAFAISEPYWSVSYAYWYGSAESGVLSGNGVVYTIHTWNNGAVVIEAYSYNQTSYDIIRFNGSTWTVTTYNANQ